MTVTNDFLPFAQASGANVETQAAYASDPAQTLGQQPGIASSALNNKALRQANSVASQVAQFIANQTQTSAQDNGIPVQFLAQLSAALQFLPPVKSAFTASGSFNPTYYFFIASGSATVGATYTNNSITFTVSSTISAGTLLQVTGPAAPLTSGTLTKVTGTGDASITFYAMRAPLYADYELIAGGGGGGGANSATNAQAGGGGGGACRGRLSGTAIQSLIAVIVGAGGTGGAASGAAGNPGGTSQISGTAIATVAVSGGGGGGGSSTSFAPGAGGSVTAGSPTVSFTGSSGGSGSTNTSSVGNYGGDGGTSVLGGGGYGATDQTGTGGSAAIFGGGGGGAIATAASGGNGVGGLVTIDCHYQ